MKKIITHGLIFVIIDQLSKLIITHTLDINETVTVIKDFFYLTNLTNHGAAWNILEGNSLFLIILGFIAIGFIITLIKEEKEITSIGALSYSLLLGGIVGNLLDRIYNGGVIDFIYINVLDFPVFNISDMCIVLGVIIFAYINIRSEIDVRIQSTSQPQNRQVSRRGNGRNQNQNSKTNKK